MNSTSSTLIDGLTHEDCDAWHRFMQIYKPHLLGWARLKGLKSDEAEDAVGELLYNLVKHISAFKYDGNKSFRGYLCRALSNTIANLKSREKGPLQFSLLDEDVESIKGESASSTLLDHLCNREDQALLIMAARDVQMKTGARDWTIYQQSVGHSDSQWSLPLDFAVLSPRKSAKQLAAQFGISEGTVRNQRARVAEAIRTRWMELRASG
ncbi:MAG: sigma-70 family RNA polymerase sigma factor [Planctomycetota bacterium]